MALTYNLETDARYIQGIEQGIEKGLEKGLEKGKFEIAQKLLLSGQSVEFTADITGLDIDKVLQLQQSNPIDSGY
jgi:predicted transposase/invertase (TIGR01784 family)